MDSPSPYDHIVTWPALVSHLFSGLGFRPLLAPNQATSFLPRSFSTRFPWHFWGPSVSLPLMPAVWPRCRLSLLHGLSPCCFLSFFPSGRARWRNYSPVLRLGFRELSTRGFLWIICVFVFGKGLVRYLRVTWHTGESWFDFSFFF